MATFNQYNIFADQLSRGAHDFSAHRLRVALTLGAPNSSAHTTLSDVSQINYVNIASDRYFGNVHIANGPGNSSQVLMNDLDIVASNGPSSQFRYLVVHNEDVTNGLIGWYDYGSATRIEDGQTFELTVGASNNVFLTIG